MKFTATNMRGEAVVAEVEHDIRGKRAKVTITCKKGPWDGAYLPWVELEGTPKELRELARTITEGLRKRKPQPVATRCE